MEVIIPIYGKCLSLSSFLNHIEEARLYSYCPVLFVLAANVSSEKRELVFAWSKAHANTRCEDSTPSSTGFFDCANTGVLSTKGDVALLAPAVRTTSGWLKKMEVCVDQSSHLAGVIPVSNYGSGPELFKYLDITSCPKGISVDDFGMMVEQGSLCDYPRVNAGNNFCMLLTRQALDRIGRFDVENYGNSPATAVDYAYRARLCGFSFCLCDNTYMHCDGDATDQDLSDASVGEERLQQEYPYLEELRHQELEREDRAVLTSRVLLTSLYSRFLKGNGKKNILYVMHYDFRPDSLNHLGGVQFHVKDLVDSLRGDYNLFVAARDADGLRLTLYSEDIRLSFKYDLFPWQPYPIENDWALRKTFRTILKSFSIDIVHIHCVVDLSFDIFCAAQEKKIPIVATVHDNYYICPNINLLDHNNAICADEMTPDRCKECMRDKRNSCDGDILVSDWREQNQKYLQMCETVVVPSQSVADTYLRYYPMLEDKLLIIEHGTDLVKYDRTKEEDCPPDMVDDESVKYYIDSVHISSTYTLGTEGWAYYEGVPSAEAEIKLKISDGENQQIYPTEIVHRPDLAVIDEKYCRSGFKAKIPVARYNRDSLTLAPAIILHDNPEAVLLPKNEYDVSPSEEKETGKRLKVAFIGGVNYHKGSQEIIKLLRIMKDADCAFYAFGTIDDADIMDCVQPNFYMAGRYERKDLPSLLFEYDIDVICILSILGETFCYTLSEAFICGIPVITTNIGAQGQRVRDSGAGWTVPLDGVAENVKDILDMLMDNPEELAEKQNTAEMVAVKTVREMADDYSNIYERFPSGTHQYAGVTEIQGAYQRAHNKPALVQKRLEDNNRILASNNRLLEEERGLLQGQVEDWKNRYSDVINSVSWKSTALIRKLLSIISRKT